MRCPQCGFENRDSSVSCTYCQYPFGDKPTNSQPTNDRPTYSQPTYDQPTSGQPTYDQPTSGQPTYGQPMYGQPGYGQPPYGQPHILFQVTPEDRANRMAKKSVTNGIIGLVMSIILCFIPFGGLTWGTIALVQGTKAQKFGSTKSMGIILGIIDMILGILGLIIVIGLIFGFWAGGHSGVERIDYRVPDKIVSHDVQTIKSSESNLTLEFPDSWTPSTDDEAATINMKRSAKDQYMRVYEDSADDFDKDYTFEDYVFDAVDYYLSFIDSPEEPRIMEAMIGNGIRAKQFEIFGSYEKSRIKCYFTLAEANGIYYEFYAWSTWTKYDEAKPVFDSILQSAMITRDLENREGNSQMY